MADHFEKAMQDIATRSAANGGPTIGDVLVALVAANEDSEETAARLAKTVESQHAESLNAIEDNRVVLVAHCVEADLRDTRIEVLEGWRHEQATTCVARVTQIAEKVAEAVVASEHGARHDAHMAACHAEKPRRKEDPPEADFTEKRDIENWGNSYGVEQAKQIWLMWLLGTAVGRVLIYVAGGASMLAIDHFFGG